MLIGITKIKNVRRARLLHSPRNITEKKKAVPTRLNKTPVSLNVSAPIPAGTLLENISIKIVPKAEYNQHVHPQCAI